MDHVAQIQISEGRNFMDEETAFELAALRKSIEKQIEKQDEANNLCASLPFGKRIAILIRRQHQQRRMRTEQRDHHVRTFAEGDRTLHVFRECS
jgi:hypothetical protein